MTVEEIIKQCDTQIAMLGEAASITLIIPGRWGKRSTRRLCKGGPTGEIVSDNFKGPGIIVMFNAVEVRRFLLSDEIQKKLTQETCLKFKGESDE